MIRLRTLLAGAALVVALVMTACGDGAPSPSGGGGGTGGGGGAAGTNVTGQTANQTVNAVTGQKFNPDTINVKVGQVVEWKNTDTIAHNVTFDGQDSISTSLLSPGQTWEVKFATAGTYSYQCTFHPGMTGKVTVS